MCLATITASADIINLTPKPKDMTTRGGTLVINRASTVGCVGLPDSIIAEADKFINDINTATPLEMSKANTGQGNINLTQTPSYPAEGYKLDITAEGISIEATTTAGFYYAFQSIKKMLPQNVMAGVKDPSVTQYTLPLVTINDEPRYGYRGFMLDVSRHFSTVAEVKRMIDIMAAYKMNVFHWHLTDDQGWRIEIKKYPKLTEVGSIRANSWTVDMKYGDYWTNEQYGPYYYTQEDIAEIIDYCHQRHIKVIPEVDMPGHFVAAMASYPQYSCNPSGNHSVWINGGVSSDVLNVANPEAVTFAKDILSEIMDLFPDKYIHIGGDECPTSAWQNNAECQALYTKLGLTNYRQLQSHFIKEISDFVKQRGYHMFMWNESITADGADLEMMKQTGATVMSWHPCQEGALKAAQLGLDNIVTEYHSATGGYYINRKQSTDPGEPSGAGYGDDTVEGCYNYVPLPSSVSSDLQKYYKGVQATFWTEHVANREYLEYLALPRLMAVAEAGWTPQNKKDFSDFRLRMMADTVMLNYNNYQYGRHAWTTAKIDTMLPEKGIYYRRVTRAGDTRKDRCIELLSQSSPLLSEYADKGAQANRLWTNSQAEETDLNYAYQQWTFEQSPTNPSRYALVCKAIPKGSLNASPSANSTAGRWTYDNTTKHYDFVLGDRVYGTAQNDGSTVAYNSIRSANGNDLFLNASLAGQGFAVNVYGDPASGNGGVWTMIPTTKTTVSYPDFSQELWNSLPKIIENDTLIIKGAVEGYQDIFISDRTGQLNLIYNIGEEGNTRWVAQNVTPMDSSYTQTMRLYNPVTRRYISGSATNKIDKLGYPVKMTSSRQSAAQVAITYKTRTNDWQVMAKGYNLYPVSSTSTSQASTICSGSTVTSDSQAIRPQGAAWLIDNTTLTPVNDLQTVVSAPKNTSIYNLMGQQLNEISSPGIYIVNGKTQKH